MDYSGIQDTGHKSKKTRENNADLSQSELAIELCKLGLEPSVWMTKLKDVLDIDKVQQLQHCSILDIEKLEKHTDKAWEVRALRTLIKDKNQDNLIHLKNVLTATKESYQQCGSVDISLEKLRSLFSVPDGEWECKLNKIDKDKIMNSLEFRIAKVNERISQFIFKDEEVIKKASGGLAFMGVYVSDEINDLCCSRQTVIQLCKHVNLRSSINEQKHDDIDFSSKEMSRKFHLAMDVVGINISASVKVSNCRIGALFRRERQKFKSSLGSEHSNFYSRIKYSSIPVKSCEFKPTDVCLVPEAIECLLNIEYFDQLFCREEFIIAECQKFFKQFGSHINIGTLHFGGVYKWISTYSSETQSSDVCAQQLVATSLNSYISTDVPCITGIGAEVSAECLFKKGDNSQSYSRSDLSNTRLTVQMCGGPIGIDDFYTWKYMLSSCNDTWSLIDRGNLRGIWEIINLHTTFKDSLKLSQTLEKASMSKLDASNMDFSKDRSFAELVAILLDEVQNWNKTPSASKCSSILETILKCKKLKIEIDGNLLPWLNLLQRESTIKHFFSIIIDIENNYEETHKSYIKYLVREILHPALDDRFVSWFEIIKWTTEKKEDELSNFEKESIQTIADLLRVIKTKVLPTILYSSVENEVRNKSLEEEATCLIAKLCYQCFSSLEDKGNSYDIVLLKVMLMRLLYDSENSFFPINLSGSDMEIFIDESEHYLLEYSTYVDCSVAQLQAFLIHKTVVRLKQFCLFENMKGKFDECLSSIRNILDDKISAVIQEYNSSSPCNWRLLEHDLFQLERGEEISQHVFSTPKINFDSPQTTIQVYVEENCSKTFLGYLDQIGLAEYFPDKICIRHILLNNIDSENPKYTDLPWIFLQEILMCNSNARDKNLHLRMDDLIKLKNPQSGKSDDWNELNSPSNNHTHLEHINPLDLLMAVYKCCTPSLKQILAMNLFSCKQAVPLILPSIQSVHLTVSMWPLRQIFIEQTRNCSFLKMSAIHFPCKIISFIRLNELQVSKSKIINYILDDKGYNTFFNFDCPLGDSYRTISDGMVEASWYIPQKDEKENATLFLNLRGDAMSYPKQRDFLIRMSSILFVAIDLSDLKKEHKTKVISDMHILGRHVILAVDCMKANSQEFAKSTCQTYLRSLNECARVTKTRIMRLALNGKRLGLSKITEEIKECIRKLSTENSDIVSLSDQFKKADITDAILDEELICVHKRVSEKIDELKNLLPTNSQTLKNEIMPLQSISWNFVSEIYKNLKKTSEFIPRDQRDNLKQEIIKHRLIQLQQIENLHKFMVAFIRILAEASYQTVYCEILISRLKLLLFDVSKLEEIENAYHSSLLSLKLAEDKKSTKIREYQSDVNECERQLSVASFGFEHLVREIGQIYETLTEPELQKKIDQQSNDFAAQISKMCARIVAIGQPFEIMDGDAANVPKRWVKSVLSELQSLIGDKKYFILSVLGVQSSGKSTLLNTMFGLHFPVSAGRCTKGIFMQLVPINEKTCRYDYILVMDTEGLRANDSMNMKYDNDNKLAIFVIGMADITVINIQGENPCDIRDTLQITVLAFLRLRQAQRKIQLHQRCLFVHRNVSAVNAVQKLARARENLVKQLNEITKEAAENEKADISTFRQIIEFDSVHDISYLPELWLGSPPMAPRNHEYSSAVAELKETILSEKSDVNKNYFTLTDISVRIEKLWIAILSDDFVYNFRNPIELKAYTILQSHYQDTVYKIEKFALDFKHCDAQNELSDCDKESLLEGKAALLMKKSKRQIHEKSQILKKEITSFIDKHDLQHYMKQWEQTRLIKLTELADNLVYRVQTEIQTLKEETMFQFREQNVISDLNKLATKHARNHSGKTSDDKMLKQIFHEKWIEWMTMFSSQNPKLVRTSIENEIRAHAYNVFTDLNYYFNQFIEKPSKHDYKNMKRIEGSIVHSDLENQYVEVIGSCNDKIKVWRDSEHIWRNKTIEFTDALFQKIDRNLDQVRGDNIQFNILMAITIFNIIKDDIQKFNTDKTNPITLQQSYQAMIIVHVLRYTTHVFEAVDAKYNLQHNLQARLEKHKHSTFITFKGLILKQSGNFIAADIILDVLTQKIIKHVYNNIPIDIHRKIQLKFERGKESILKCLLSSMVEEGNFNTFSKYIKNPSHALREWMEKHINDTILSPLDSSSESEYTKIAKTHIDEIFMQLSRNLKLTGTSTTENDTISQWVNSFVENASFFRNLSFSRKDFVSIENMCVDIKRLAKCVLDKISKTKDNVCLHFTTKENCQYRKDCINGLLSMFWGCEVTCPFCNEPCIHPNKDHLDDKIPHACLQHRVTGITGYHFEPNWYKVLESTKLVIRTCEDLLKSDTCFYYNGDFVPYEDYKKYIPNWEINSEKSSNQFWKWYVFNFKSEIEKEYHLKFPYIPDSWKCISKKEAIDSLF